MPWLDSDEPEQTPTTVGNGPTGEPTTGPSDTIETATRSDPETETEYLAPGVTTDGVENVSLLLENHFAVLERESRNGTYITSIRSTRYTLGIPLRTLSTVRVRYAVQYPDRWYYSWTRINQTSNETKAYEAWVNTSVALLRPDVQTHPARYSLWRNYSLTPGHPEAVERRLRRDLASVEAHPWLNVTVTERVHDGNTVYVVTRTSENTYPEMNTTTTRTFYIRDDGFIIYYTIGSIRVPFNGERTVLDTKYTFEIHPNGSLAPPAWINEAHKGANDSDAEDEK